MTFSILGRCPRTGQFGAAVATSNIAVGARVAHCAAGVGGILTQHRTDPRLGPRGLAGQRYAPETGAYVLRALEPDCAPAGAG